MKSPGALDHSSAVEKQYQSSIREAAFMKERLCNQELLKERIVDLEVKLKRAEDNQQHYNALQAQHEELIQQKKQLDSFCLNLQQVYLN